MPAPALRTTNQVSYSERIGAPVWCWFAMLGLTLCLAIAFFVPLGPIAGASVLVAGIALTLYVLLTTALSIKVTPTELRVGSAHIGWQYTGIVATLDSSSTKSARTVEADARAFTALRPMSVAESVTIEVIDDDDPHPYWLISSKDPQALGQAITAAQRTFDQLSPTDAGRRS